MHVNGYYYAKEGLTRIEFEESYDGIYWATLRVSMTSSYMKSRLVCNWGVGGSLFHCVKSDTELYCSMNQYSPDSMWGYQGGGGGGLVWYGIFR